MSERGRMRIRFQRLDRQFASLRAPILQAVLSVLEQGQVLQGPNVEELEARLARLHRVKHAVAVDNGSDAMLIAIAALGLPAGSRVAVPAMTFVASASAIVLNQHRPVFVDVDPATMLMDSSVVLDLVRRRQVDAVIAVHLYGQLADLDELAREARERGIALVEDAAQALGASRHGRPPAAWGDVSSLSFDPTKVVGACGSGGALLTNSDTLAESARLLRYHGHAGAQVYQRLGFNSQMDSLQAAIINVKLDALEQWQDRRRQIAARFTAGLRQAPSVRPLAVLPGNVHNLHKFVVVAEHRDWLQRTLATWGIQTKIHYPVPLHMQPCFSRHVPSGLLPHAERAAQTVLSLPLYPELTDDEVDDIVACVLDAADDAVPPAGDLVDPARRPVLDA
jgi:dTDP-4-amino-4,6-dideoxygalactose transaminase